MKKSTAKIFTLLLAWYVLSLSMAPCVDTSLDFRVPQHVCAGHPSNDAGADHHDSCSPFCTCSCCNLAMEVEPSCMVTIASCQPQKRTFSFTPRFISCFTYVIWEPPKA
ncbi:MAG: DUF6660 family protein [Bacteroidota bacterium]